ncbi:hypothetical protein HPB50_014812 [Hyalomma asiaticum]|uniref:Uncharacterized protein n=1 Tax=Hyalomma asiaticum TaxID=266040 RepID=A0ACB7SHN7_HYAAI|nr:hypothetical protein HPB50_014812 [Hyalomma asiaticum]
MDDDLPPPSGHQLFTRCLKEFCTRTDVAESTGNSVPLSEVLLQNALLVMQSLAGALQNNAQAAPQSARPCVKVDMPTYSGYHDSKSANEYLDRLLYYQQATGLTDAELLTRSKWLGGSDWLDITPARECNFADPEELAAATKRIQGDILAAQAYRLPPSAAMSLEPRCAWNGGAVAAQSHRANVSTTFADEQVDPCANALTTAPDSPVRDAPRQEHEANMRPGVWHATEQQSYSQLSQMAAMPRGHLQNPSLGDAYFQSALLCAVWETSVHENSRDEVTEHRREAEAAEALTLLGTHPMEFADMGSALIIFVSDCFGGRASDKACVDGSDIISKLEPFKDDVMVDKDFNIDSACASFGIDVVQPHFCGSRQSFHLKMLPKP